MEQEGAKRVELVAKDDKRQITAVFAVSFTGDFLPPQLAYQGKSQSSVSHNFNFRQIGILRFHQIIGPMSLQ